MKRVILVIALLTIGLVILNADCRMMSKFPNDTDSFYKQEIFNDELVYLSQTGFKVSVENCSDANAIVTHNRKLHRGWNWESFPIFPTTTNNGPDILEYLETNGEITRVVNEPRYLNAVYYTQDQYWNPANFIMNDKTFYKLEMTNDTNEIHNDNCFTTVGTVRDRSIPLIGQALGYQEYWVGYDLINSQRIDIAFGDNWRDVKAIKGENWSYQA